MTRFRPSLWSVLCIAVVATLALGARPRITKPPADTTPTFSAEIVRLFQANCQTCHQDGDIAPFPLTTYEEAKPWAASIKRMVTERHMPPWKPDASCLPLQGERRLTDAEIALVARWVDAGAPEGDRNQLPPPLERPSNWSAGEPDIVLTVPQPFTVSGDKDIYRCFPIDPKLATDAAVRAVDTRPGDRSLVHHVIAFIDTSGASVSLDAQDAAPGYPCFGGPGFASDNALGGWAPGARPSFLPDGVATKLPASSRVVLQIHYHPDQGRTGTDQTQIGLYTAKAPVTQWLRYVPLMNDTFTIPAGARSHVVEATFSMPRFASAKVWNITPHMHLLGRTMKVEATLPSGEKLCLINIDDWDFNWQGTYAFEQPVSLPGGSFLRMVATYDNSSDNPRNPNNPPKPVFWGEQTTDEMAVTFLGVTVDGISF